MQQTLIITVKGSRRAIDIEVPSNIPVSDLLPLLLEMCGDADERSGKREQSTPRGFLSIMGVGKPLAPTLTLAANQVLDGDVLLLTKSVQALVPVLPEGPGAIIPSANTGMIGVTWTRETLL